MGEMWRGTCVELQFSGAEQEQEDNNERFLSKRSFAFLHFSLLSPANLQMVAAALPMDRRAWHARWHCELLVSSSDGSGGTLEYGCLPPKVVDGLGDGGCAFCSSFSAFSIWRSASSTVFGLEFDGGCGVTGALVAPQAISCAEKTKKNKCLRC
jgi:hypothetical protein